MSREPVGFERILRDAHRESDLANLTADNFTLRKALWNMHPDFPWAAYGDDGEMQIKPCDFKRDPVEFVIEFVMKALSAKFGELRYALEESVKLQAHYAELLNQHDGGKRIVFKDAVAWVERLRQLRAETEEAKDRIEAEEQQNDG